jgi:hypothetical protein
MTVIQDANGDYLSRSETGDWVPAKISINPTTGTRHVYDGNDWKLLPGEEPSVGGAFGRGVIQGGTYGFNDEIEAGVRAGVQGASNLAAGPRTLQSLVTGETRPTVGQEYDRALAVARERAAIDKEQQYWPNLAGQIAGGIGAAIATRGVGPRIAGAAGVNPMVADYAVRSVNPYVRMGIGGAAAGGVAGFGEGEGLLDRLGGAGTGAGIGGVVGPVAGLGINMINRLGGRLFRGLGFGDKEAQAERQVTRALQRDKVGGTRDANAVIDEAERRSVAAGDQPVAPVDLGGRNTINLGKTVANTPGEAAEVADKFVEGRRFARPDRLSEASDAAFGGGSGTDIPETLVSLRAQRSAAREHYDRAFKIQPTTDEYGQVARWVDDPIGQDAMQRGLRLAELEHLRDGTVFRPQDYGVTRGEGGKFVPVEGETPKMRLLDAVKQGYDLIVEGFRDPTSGRLNLDRYGQLVNENRAAYRDTLTGLFHPYKRALEAWSGPSAQMDAIDAGKKMLTTNRDVVADRMTRPVDERTGYRLGAGRGVSDSFSDPARAPGRARNLLEDRNMQARLASVLEPEELSVFNGVLKREVDMQNVEKAVSPRAGSQTYPLQAGAEDMARGAPGPIMTGISQALGGHWLQGAGTIGRDVVQRRLGQGINPAMSDALANKLFTTDPAERAALYASLRNRLLTDEAAAERVRRFIAPVLQGVSQQAGAASSR